MTRQPRLNTPIVHKEEWVDIVFNDVEFIELFEQMIPLSSSNIDAHKYKSEIIHEYIKRKFRITSEDINIFRIKKLLYIENYYSKAKLTINFEDKKFAIEFDADAKKKDIESAFNQFVRIRSRLFPRKSSRDNKKKDILLTYSIAKARYSSEPLEIFNKLKEKKLEGWEGQANPFDTIKDLNDYIYDNNINKNR